MARIVYLSPHQDDEVLTMGASIMQDVADGHTVFVYLACRGDKSVARTNQILINRLGYTPTVEAFCAARDREFMESVPRLGAVPVMLPQPEREPEREVDVERLIAAVKRAIPGGADLVCGHAPTDPHEDHAAVGQAALRLRDDGWASSVRLHVAFYNKVHHPTPPNPAFSERGIPVTLFQQEPYRRVDVPNGFWGVGYISVSSLFEGQLSDSLSYHYYPFGQGGVLRRPSGLVALDADGNPARAYRTFEPWS